MTLAAGTRFGTYEVSALLGAGGMGEVYRARDGKLHRDVALKVLPDVFSLDRERLARFNREAQVLASLNHPNIATIYGVEDADGRQALVLELVGGLTLAEHVAQRAMPVEEALPIARQIADALETAHEHGILHRDLKPANIKVRPDGTVKVLDFGLAKALEPEGIGSGRPDTMSPTITTPAATRVGMILGTAAYMAPEQARGRVIDKRADIWAFGCVLFEMLTGTRPFDGEDVTETLGAVIHKEPAWTALPASTPPTVRSVLQGCLRKDPKQRIRDIGDVRLALDGAFDVAATSASAASAEARLPWWRRAATVAAAAVIAALLTGATAWYFQPAPSRPAITRFPLLLAEGQQFSGVNRRMLAISADGTQIAYVANQRLYLRSLAEVDARPIPGTEDGPPSHPVFAPDGRTVAFWAGGAIRKVAVTGGAVVTVCRAENVWGMSWHGDAIVFGQGAAGIMRVSANGGTPEVLVMVTDEQQAHGPQLLPGAESVLFTLATGTGADRWDSAQIVAQSLRSGERKTLIEGGSDAAYVSTGHIVYALGGNMFAVPADVRRLEVTGGPVPIVERVRRALGGQTGVANFSISDTGSLVYIPGLGSGSSSQQNIALIDRKGSVEPLKLAPGPYEYPRVSPGGTRVAFGTDDGREASIWIYELSGGSSMRRLTFGGKNRFPIWSADGERVAFQSDREGDLAIFWQRADGTGAAERLTKPDEGTSHVPEAWSPNGEHVLFSVMKGANASLWTLSLRDKTAAPFGGVQSLVNHTASAFSPDGRWVAYGSNETGNAGDNNVYIQPFPATGAKYQISRAGENGHDPLWSPDGRELFYVPQQGQFVVVRITTQPTFASSDPVSVPRAFGLAAPTTPRTFDITPDGRIVGIIEVGQSQSGTATQQIQVVLNWFEELKARVPVR